jgi:hypothetical protein
MIVSITDLQLRYKPLVEDRFPRIDLTGSPLPDSIAMVIIHPYCQPLVCHLIWRVKL